MGARLDLTVDQGATFVRDFKIEPADELDLSGYTARSQVRSSWASATKTIDFATVATPIAVVTSGSANKITLTLSASETAALTPGRYVWDLEIVSGAGVVTRLLEGAFVVTPEVTR